MKGYHLANPIIDGKRICWKCDEEKSVDDFHKAPGNIGGITGKCKECLNSEQLLRHKANPEYNQNASLKKLYGITLDERNAMIEAQENCCALCNTTLKGGRDIHVDHDHETGEVRSILCHLCNVGLGAFRDDPNILIRALSYLTTHGKSVNL
jgi:hypothetical protein